MSSKEALKLAYEKELDLVMIAPQATPPVCKIMDYGKFLFEKQKREKEAKKKQQTIELKEIQLSCRIDTHDYETKLNQTKKFLASGNKVRVVMKFRGREMSHMAIGRDLLEKFLEDTQDVGTCDKKPVLDGRFMSMVISPLPNKKSASCDTGQVLFRALRPAQSTDRYPYDDPHGGAVHIRSPRIPSFMPAASAVS
jgi:translation initiation factor IF-3